jgi:hypothetical protein
MSTGKQTPKELPAGIYCPTLTFFKPTPQQELDIPTHVEHMEFLAMSGINGVVLQGSTGEAVALNRDERKEVYILRGLLNLADCTIDDTNSQRNFHKDR